MAQNHARLRVVLSYLPHMAILVGVTLNVLGLVLGNTALIATGSNALTVSGLYLAQRRRNQGDG